MKTTITTNPEKKEKFFTDEMHKNIFPFPESPKVRGNQKHRYAAEIVRTKKRRK